MRLLYYNWKDRPGLTSEDYRPECRRLADIYNVLHWGTIAGLAAKYAEGINLLYHSDFQRMLASQGYPIHDYTPEQMAGLEKIYYVIYPNEAPSLIEQSHEVMIDCLLGLIT